MTLRPENPVLQSMHFIARQRENCARRSLSAIRQSLPVRQDVVIAHKDQRHPCPPPVRTCSRKAVSWPDGILARDSISHQELHCAESRLTLVPRDQGNRNSRFANNLKSSEYTNSCSIQVSCNRSTRHQRRNRQIHRSACGEIRLSGKLSCKFV